MSAKEIFLKAVENYKPKDWPVFLDGACGDNAALRQEVEELLKAHQQQDSLFDVAPTEEHVAQPLGESIGRYKLLQKIGEGGFGVVYMAEQVRPVRRNVALKIIKPGMDSKEVIARFEAERQALAMSIAISDDSRYGASSDLSGTIKVWSFPSGDVLWKKENQQPDGSSCLAFSPDSSCIAFAGLDGIVRILNAVNGSESSTTQVGAAVQSILYTPDGRELAIAGGGEVRFWRSGESGLIATNQFVPCAAWDFAFSPNGDLLAITSSDANVRVMDVEAWTELGRFSLLHAGTSVAFDKANNAIVVGVLDGNVYSWPLKRLKQDSIRGVYHFVLPLCIAEDGLVVTATDTDHSVVIWDPKRPQEPEALYEHSSRIHCVAISPNGQVFVSGDNEGRVKVFDESSKSELASWLHAGRVSDVSFSHDGSKIASAGYDGRVVVYNLGDQSETILNHSGFATAVAFSPDGVSLATGGGTYWSYGETKIWDLANKEPKLRSVDRHPNVVIRLVYSKDGQFLAGTHDYVAGVVRVWDMPQFVKRFDIKAHNGMVSAIDFLPEELRMITAGDDEGTLKFWDTTNGAQLGAYATREQVRSVRCSLDGNSIVTASKTGIVRIHNAQPK